MASSVPHLDSMEPTRSSDCDSLRGAPTPKAMLQLERKSKRFMTAGKEDMLSEIDFLQEEVELVNARLRSATEEVQHLRRQMTQSEEVDIPRRSPSSKHLGFGDLSTEAEVRWGFFVAEKSRLQSEKGWREALKESKKMLEEQLTEAQEQAVARDMELIKMKAQLSDGAKELEKEKQLVKELKVVITDLQRTLDSEHLLLAQANERNCQLEEELGALQYTKESDKMTFARDKKRLVTYNLASQMSFTSDDSEEVQSQASRVSSMLQQQSARSSLLRQFSTASQNEDGLHQRLHASEVARQELEAQIAELLQQLQRAEDKPASVQSQEEPSLRSSVKDDACEKCEVLREHLSEMQRRLQRAEHQLPSAQTQGEPVVRPQGGDKACEKCEMLREQMSEMQRQAELAQKQFRAYQQGISAPWWSSWSRMACHCGPKGNAAASTKQAVLLPEEDEQQSLQRNKPPRAAVHMEPAKNVGVTWLARPLG